MKYLVTGGTGFIGRFLVERLLKRRGSRVYVLMRKASADKYDALRERLGVSEERLIPVWGDITRQGVTDAATRRSLADEIDHVFHLAAVYDMGMSDAVADRVNNEGTRNLVDFANELGGNVRLHHMSSVAVAGAEFDGVFSDEMFDEGQPLRHPYYRTKFQSEKIVREHARVPWRVYRPGMVVGHSETGEMDKVDGPYYFFKAIQTIRDRVPKWMPLLGIGGGQMPIAPVDYVVDATDRIAHLEADKWDGRAYFLLQQKAPSAGGMLATFMEAAHGPSFVRQLPTQDIPAGFEQTFRQIAGRMPMARTLEKQLSSALGVPLSILGYVNNRTEFDDRNTRSALRGSKVKCPPLADYAETLWRYWELHMDYDVKVPKRLMTRVRGKVVLITGASSGIGFITAKKLAKGGAKVCLVARNPDKLAETREIIAKMGVESWTYPCDLNKMEAIDAMVEKVLADHHHVDILINNAGRSIRRSAFESFERFHDYERTMQLNYFGAVRLIMALLPGMGKRRTGQIINISSIGCLTNVPRFSAYVASKSALDAFSRCISGEVASRNIDITTIYMPLVRTPMIAPTKLYDYVPTLTPEQAGDMVVSAVIERPKRIASPLGTTAQVSYALWPKVNDYVLNKAFHMFPSSAVARGKRPGTEEEKPTLRGMVMAALLPGPYW
ncbi:SDR family oxidoreductase [Spectribacter hydrogenoxidans]|uniref:SDR family oxidoreductase n=1 Tax=Spectribacter hydrogenoxidans TaxID=3075608 RepID=A0ABU3BYM1_9GAMM|nr:SDR family oxidoreductase [Salinisphaera sp. W335]MDT0634383.1 SDR family oxidoreductase [Salinisphaera sp. W335]